MQRIDKIHSEDLTEADLGLLMWRLQEFENFYPCYKTMIKKEG